MIFFGSSRYECFICFVHIIYAGYVYVCWSAVKSHSLCYFVYFYVIIYCENAVGYLSGGGNVVLAMTVYMTVYMR